VSKEGFFDFHARMKARPTKSSTGGEPISPAEVNRLVEAALKERLPARLAVRGEVSNFTRNRNSGHLYFTLKDAAACLDVVMWASRAEHLKFDPQDGIEVIASGSIGVYTPRGRYQLVCQSLEPVGQGALELAKKRLIEKLAREGLLNADRRRPLPKYPRRIVLVSSPQAAGLADMLKVFSRTPAIQLMIFPVPVQGAGSAERIAEALHILTERHADVNAELIVIARGGGSLEDLAAFDNEAVVRAIVASSVPVVTGIGHEVDVSVADLVADHHAHTPTEAATVATRHWHTAIEFLDQSAWRMNRSVTQNVRTWQQRIEWCARHERFQKPAEWINRHRQRLDDIQRRMTDRAAALTRTATGELDRLNLRLMEHTPEMRLAMLQMKIDALAERVGRASKTVVSTRRDRTDRLTERLKLLNPEAILKRGYSITVQKQSGRIIRNPSEVSIGDRLVTRLAEGSIESDVVDPKQGRLF
jgi:exodeoxyribonuclease VII large subunit